MNPSSFRIARIVAALMFIGALVACDRFSRSGASTADAGTAPAATTTPPAAAAAPDAAAPPTVTCVQCATQEDFDGAKARGKVCCAPRGCALDQDCPRGRVCCRLGGGELCVDGARCAQVDRVGIEGKQCSRSKDCPGNQVCCPFRNAGRCTELAKCREPLLCAADTDCVLVSGSKKCVNNRCK